MLTTPAITELYLAATPSLLAALPASLGAPPLELLGLTATLYLGPYLSAADHRDAMRAAFERARAEAAAMSQLPRADERSQHRLPQPPERTALYRSIWRRAVVGATPGHLLLAQ